MTRLALGINQAFDDHLRGNTGVVGADLPQGVVAFHAVIADEGVHDGVLESVPHVQAAGDIRWRNHDAVGRAVCAGLRGEMAFLFPVLVPFLFNGVRVVRFVHTGRVLFTLYNRARHYIGLKPVEARIVFFGCFR